MSPVGLSSGWIGDVQSEDTTEGAQEGLNLGRLESALKVLGFSM